MISQHGVKAAIVEIAGRDSIAAAITAVRNEKFEVLVPVYAYTATEYGSLDTVCSAVEFLSSRLSGTKISGLILLGSPEFWKALNGRFTSILTDMFGFYTPCVGCHLYLHAVRIPLARFLGNLPVISGERESHSGVWKINQTPSVIDKYENFCRRFQTRIIFPLRRVSSGREIEKILSCSWQRGAGQLQCVLSGNYIKNDGSLCANEKDVIKLLEGFLLPCADMIIEAYLKGVVPDHVAIAKKIIDSLCCPI